MLRAVIIAAGTVMVIMDERAPAVAHAPDRVKIITGLVFGLPCLLLVMLITRLANRAEKAKTAASTQRPVYPFGGQRR